jgi:uncharacterized protein DUF5994
MLTSNHPTSIPADSPDRVPLRLRLAEHPGRNQLDGGWWLQSRNLLVEFADLVDHFPSRFGRVVRGLYSPPDWEPAPRRIPVSGRYVKVGCFPRDDTHLITLTTSYGNVLRVLVVPSLLSASQGAEALLASATPRNASTAVSLLGTVTELPDVDPAGQWSDSGDSWWHPHPTPPSVRTGG